MAQDDALALGTVDKLKAAGFEAAFGPGARASEIEGNKAWARKFMERHELPVPEYHVFDRETELTENLAISFLEGAYNRPPGSGTRPPTRRANWTCPHCTRPPAGT